MKNKPLLTIFLSIFLAVLAGLLTGPESAIFGVPIVRIYGLIGTLFLNALSLVVVPLVVSSIITGTARLGSDKNFSKLGFQTFFYFILTGVIAVAIGAFVMTWLSPGSVIDSSLLTQLNGSDGVETIQKIAEGGVFDRIEQILYRLIPQNIFYVISQGQMLGVIFFALLFGFFSNKIDSELSNVLVKFWKGVFQTMMLMTQFIMRALPIGVFGLMAKVIAVTGFEAVKPIGFFFGTILLGLGLYIFVVLPILLQFIARVNPLNHFKAAAPALITAFTTSSSAATLPVTIGCMEKVAGIPNRICSFILPLGTTINLTGTALYATGAVLFVAQAYGFELNLANYLTVLFMGLFTALGMVAGIPSASLITIVVILQAIGLPADGIILLLPVERILDMCRTTVNVFGTTCCAAMVNASVKSEKN